MDVFLICFIVITPIFGIIAFGIGFWTGVAYITKKYLQEQKRPKKRQVALEGIQIEPELSFIEPNYAYLDTEQPKEEEQQQQQSLLDYKKTKKQPPSGKKTTTTTVKKNPT
jgi:hypothetical protein